MIWESRKLAWGHPLYSSYLSNGPIQPSLRLHLQTQIQTTVWTKRKSSNRLAFGWNIFSKNPQFLLQMYIKASNHKCHLGSLKTTSNSLIKQTPHNKNTSQHLSGKKFLTIVLHHPDHQYIFTDGSKDSNKTACDAVLNKIIHKKALPMKSSIFTAEVRDIDLALNIISKDKHKKTLSYKKCIVLSNSVSVLTSLRNKKLENPLIVKLLSHEEIILCWILSPIGVSWNERADSTAKSALDLSPDNIYIPYTDLKPQINKFFLKKW